MQRIAFKMQLNKGFEVEYKKRHTLIWPELQSLLKETGISEYSIFLNEITYELFAYLKVSDELALTNLPKQPIMQQWWHFMKDIMQCNADNSPVSIPLTEVFYLH